MFLVHNNSNSEKRGKKRESLSPSQFVYVRYGTIEKVLDDTAHSNPTAVSFGSGKVRGCTGEF